MSNPLDDYLQSKAPMKKVAIFGTGQRILPGMGRFMRSKNLQDIGSGALQMAGGLAVSGLAGAAGKAYQAIRKKRDFDEMMDTNPDLEEFHRDNPKLFNRHYTSLRSMNPTLAQDPVVAGGIMRQMSQTPQVAGKVLVEYMRNSPQGPALEVGAKATPKGPESSFAVKGMRPLG